MLRIVAIAAIVLVTLSACSGTTGTVLPECYGAARSATEYECASDYGGIDATKRTAPVQDGAEGGVEDIGESCACPVGTACFTADIGGPGLSVFCALTAK